MAMPSSGAITFAQMQTEFGGSNPIGFNEYYAGGSLVNAQGSIPSSGTISLSNFYGAEAGNSTAIMTSGTYAVPNDKYSQAYTGYSNYSAGGAYTTGSATDTTMKGSNGTEYTVRVIQASTNTIINSIHFAVYGNYNGLSFTTLFGNSGISWGGTRIATDTFASGSSSNGVYQANNGGRTQWTLTYNSTPSGSNQTVAFI